MFTCDSVFADDSSSGTSSPAHSNDTLEEITFERPRYKGEIHFQQCFGYAFKNNIIHYLICRRRHQRSWTSTRVQPFSFDERDTIQRVQREGILQEFREMRQMQVQLWVRMLSSEKPVTLKTLTYLICVDQSF